MAPASTLLDALVARRAETVCLAEADRALFGSIPVDVLRRHAPATVVRQVRAGRGPLALPVQEPGDIALLVLEGFLLGRVTADRWTRAELIGPGDVLDSDNDEEDEAVTKRTWCALSTLKLARLDTKFLRRAPSMWASVLPELTARARRRTDRLMRQHAILAVRRIETRVLLLLGEIGSAWGRIDDVGVDVPVGLTHQMLAELAGARRPTVTSAVAELARQGDLERRPAGAWWISRRAVEAARADVH